MAAIGRGRSDECGKWEVGKKRRRYGGVWLQECDCSVLVILQYAK